MAYTASVLSSCRGHLHPGGAHRGPAPHGPPPQRRHGESAHRPGHGSLRRAGGVPGLRPEGDSGTCWAVKTRTTDSPDAFESVNWPLAASRTARGLDPPGGHPRHRRSVHCGTSCATRCSSSSSPPDPTRDLDMSPRCTTGASSSRAFGAGGRTSSGGSDCQAPGGRPGGHDRGGVLPVPLRAQRLLRLRGGAEGSGPGGDPGPGYDHRGGGDQAHVGAGPDRRSGDHPGLHGALPGRGRWRNQTGAWRSSAAGTSAAEGPFQDCEEEAETLWARYHSPQRHISSRMGARLRPKSVRLYSVLGGTTG